MVAPPLHDVINAPVKHIALQLVFYAVLHAPVCHPKDRVGSSTWLQQNALMQLKFALEYLLTSKSMHPEQIYCDWEQHLSRWFFLNFCRNLHKSAQCCSGRSDLYAAGHKPNPAGIDSEVRTREETIVH